MWFLKGLKTDERQLLRRHLVPQDMERGEVMFEKGVSADKMYFIEAGSVQLFRIYQKGTSRREETVKVIREGEFFGEEAILGDEGLYQLKAISLETGVLHVLSKVALERIMAESVSGGTKILLEISRSYREVLVDPGLLGSMVMFYGPRDGGGRTTMAINSAILLAKQTGQQVAFLDADFQMGNGAMMVGCSPVPNIAKLIQKEPDIRMDNMKWCLQPKYGVDFLWGTDMPQESELITREALQKIIRELRLYYPYVVVESKSFIDENTLLLWDESDRIFIVGTPNMGFLERMVRLKRLFESLDYDPERFYGVMSKHKHETGEFLLEFEKLLKRPVFPLSAAEEITQSAEIARIPVVVQNPACAYVKNLAPLLNVIQGNDNEPTKSGGIFSRLANLFS